MDRPIADDVVDGDGSSSPSPSRRSLSQDSHRGPNLARSNSGASTRSARSRTQRLVFATLPSPTPITPPRPAYSGGTHASGIQPPAGFFRPSRPNIPASWHPPEAPFASLSATTVPDEATFAASKRNESESSLPREPSPVTWDMSPENTFADRKRPARLQLSREPLLPIGGGGPKRPPQHTAQSSISGTSDIRSSFEKIFRRRSTETKTSTPSHQMKSVIPLHGPLPEDIHISKDLEGAIVLQPSTPRSPRTPKTPRTPASPRSAHSISYMYQADALERPRPSFLTFHPFPPGGKPVTSFPERPVYDDRTKNQKRNHQGYPSNNVFFLNGLLVTGGKKSPLPFIATVILVLGLAGTWLGTTAVWWIRRGGGGIAIAALGIYLALLAIVNMFVTAFRDPGILPRNLDSDPPLNEWVPDGNDEEEPQPLPRDILVRQNLLRIKYCMTCKTYRPPRSTHCRLCDNCVDGCDHHCQWLNTCVGRRNYTSFIVTLFFATITLIYTAVTAALHIALQDGLFKQRLRDSIGSVVVFLLALAMLVPVGALLSYHVRLLYHNTTTVERLRTQAHIKLLKQHSGSTTSLPRNPFEMKWYYNIAYLLCRPAGFDWIEASARKMEDARTLNPGVLFQEGIDIAPNPEARGTGPQTRGEIFREKEVDVFEQFDSVGRRNSALNDGTMVISLEKPRDLQGEKDYSDDTNSSRSEGGEVEEHSAHREER